jgi:glyoxylase-like metal-dependent hydrolase (beta-lactamase superfamily II)
MRLGGLELQIVPDATFRLDGGAMFGVVPKVLWEKKARPDERNRIAVATNCLLVKGPDFVAVVDAGLGDKWDEKSREMYQVDSSASLPRSLARHGVAPEDVDALILSHLHWDHCGGATATRNGRTVAAFSNAAVYVQEAELDHARAPHERDRASYRSENWEPLALGGRLAAVAGEKEIRPGLTVVPVRGHNEGMQAVRIDSEGETAFFFSDALPTSAHVPVAWMMAFDLYPVDLIENKKRLTDQAAREGWLCVFVHDPDVPWGKIVDEVNGKRRVHPIPREAEGIVPSP